MFGVDKAETIDGTLERFCLNQLNVVVDLRDFDRLVGVEKCATFFVQLHDSAV